MPISDFPVFNYYDVQRFKQFSPQDCANWYLTQAPTGKKKNALYPTMGRQHINYLGENVLIYDIPPRAIFRSINFMYVIIGSRVVMVNEQFSSFMLTNTDFNRTTGDLFFAFLPIINSQVVCLICDGIHCYLINETDRTMTTITDTNTPANPVYVAAFGNRFVVAGSNTTTFNLTQINCIDGTTGMFDPATLFTVPGAGGSAVFAQESGIIRQFAVLKNNLYIFTNFTTGIWSNTPSQVFVGDGNVAFPWKKNTSYDWDYGIADALSLDIDFGMIVWLAQNRNGLVQFMSSDGQTPTKISTQAINTLLQQGVNMGQDLPFLTQSAVGFLYQYEDTIFYRIAAGESLDDAGMAIIESASCIEFNFDTQTWHRCIEVNGGRNLIQDHVFFSSKHIVTVLGQRALYEMAGNIYFNELINPVIIDQQSVLFFLAYPMRYEMTTPLIAQDDYSEFKTNYVEIDFVWGYGFVNFSGPFQSTVFLVSELSTVDNPVYLVAEDGSTYLISENGNIPTLDSSIYNALFKPHIELYWSDDGGITFSSADVLEFSQLGVYSWRMRWYQLGTSRNRSYYLVAVSPTPVVILGACHDVMRISGGAN